MDEKKRRSSIRKTRSTNENPDNTEIPDITLVKARRVSFASSHAVKPFLDDPEKITIWDRTYEEELNQNDSETAKCTSVIANQNREPLTSSEFVEIEDTIKSVVCIKNRLSKIGPRKIVETINDKENVFPCQNTILLEKTMDMTEISRNKMDFSQVNMEFTKTVDASININNIHPIKIVPQQTEMPLTNKNTSLLEKTMDIIELSGNQFVLNQSDMEVTCKIIDNWKETAMKTVFDDGDMEFTSVILTENYTRNTDKIQLDKMSSIDTPTLVNNNNFHLPQQKNTECIEVDTDSVEMEFTCVNGTTKTISPGIAPETIYEDEKCSNTAIVENLEISHIDMEFTGVIHNMIKVNLSPQSCSHLNAKDICKSDVKTTKKETTDMTLFSSAIDDTVRSDKLTGILLEKTNLDSIYQEDAKTDVMGDYNVSCNSAMRFGNGNGNIECASVIQDVISPNTNTEGFQIELHSQVQSQIEECNSSENIIQKNPEEIDKCMKIKESVPTSQQTNFNPNLDKVVYSEPLIIKTSNTLRITDEINFDNSIQNTNYSNMSPCIDNTQQLINAQVPKENSFSFSHCTLVDTNNETKQKPLSAVSIEIKGALGLPVVENRSATFIKQSNLRQDNKSTRYQLFEGDPLSDSRNVSQDSVKSANCLLELTSVKPNYDFTYIKHETQLQKNQCTDLFSNFSKENQGLKANSTSEDETSNNIVRGNGEEFVDVKCEGKSEDCGFTESIIKKHQKEINLITNKPTVNTLFHSIQEDDMEVDASESFRNYTFRAESKLSKISNLPLISWQPSIKKDDARLERLMEESEKLCIQMRYTLNTFEIPVVEIEDIEEKFYDNESRNISDYSSSKTESKESDVQLSDNRDNESLYQHILDASKRNEDGWKLQGCKDDKYFFTTLYDTIVIIVTVEQETRRVCDFDFRSTLSGTSSNIGQFLHKQFLQALAKEHLRSVMGPTYDILAFLEYIYITHSKINTFLNEFENIQNDFGKRKYINGFSMTSDMRTRFDVLNASHIVYWEVNIKMNSIEHMQAEDVTVNVIYGENIINESHVQDIAKSIPKGTDCLKKFVDHFYDYVLRKTQLKWKK